MCLLPDTLLDGLKGQPGERADTWCMNAHSEKGGGRRGRVISVGVPRGGTGRSSLSVDIADYFIEVLGGGRSIAPLRPRPNS